MVSMKCSASRGLQLPVWRGRAFSPLTLRASRSGPLDSPSVTELNLLLEISLHFRSWRRSSIGSLQINHPGKKYHSLVLTLKCSWASFNELTKRSQRPFIVLGRLLPGDTTLHYWLSEVNPPLHPVFCVGLWSMHPTLTAAVVPVVTLRCLQAQMRLEGSSQPVVALLLIGFGEQFDWQVVHPMACRVIFFVIASSVLNGSSDDSVSTTPSPTKWRCYATKFSENCTKPSSLGLVKNIKPNHCLTRFWRLKQNTRFSQTSALLGKLFDDKSRSNPPPVTFPLKRNWQHGFIVLEHRFEEKRLCVNKPSIGFHQTNPSKAKCHHFPSNEPTCLLENAWGGTQTHCFEILDSFSCFHNKWVLSSGRNITKHCWCWTREPVISCGLTGFQIKVFGSNMMHRIRSVSN